MERPAHGIARATARARCSALAKCSASPHRSSNIQSSVGGPFASNSESAEVAAISFIRTAMTVRRASPNSGTTLDESRRIECGKKQGGCFRTIAANRSAVSRTVAFFQSLPAWHRMVRPSRHRCTLRPPNYRLVPYLQWLANPPLRRLRIRPRCPCYCCRRGYRHESGRLPYRMPTFSRVLGPQGKHLVTSPGDQHPSETT